MGDLLVTFRPEGGAPPLCLIHPGEGELGYVGALLPWLAPGFPLLGVAAPGLAPGEQTLHSVPEMAALYLRALRAVQPHGPYRLGGWSFGGVVAWEMARQLLAAGQEVGFLALIDSHAGSGLQGQEGVAEVDLDDLLAQAQASGKIPAGVDVPTARRHLAVRHGIARAAAAYRPPRLPLAAHLFTAASAGRDDPGMGWAGLPEGGLRMLEIGGTHYSLVEEPHVQALGAALSAALGQGGV